MKYEVKLLGILSAAALFLAVEPAVAQALYMEDFDVDHTANWITDNPPIGYNAAITMTKPQDFTADIFFDYSTVGIPSAPNSTGGTTRGMKLQADLFSDALGGGSVSPKDQNFTGDYSVRFDLWTNTVGPFP